MAKLVFSFRFLRLTRWLPRRSGLGSGVVRSLNWLCWFSYYLWWNIYRLSSSIALRAPGRRWNVTSNPFSHDLQIAFIGGHVAHYTEETRPRMIVSPFTRHRGAGHRRGGVEGGTGAPFRDVKGVLRSHTAHQEGSECLVRMLINQGKGGSVVLLLPNK